LISSYRVTVELVRRKSLQKN